MAFDDTDVKYGSTVDDDYEEKLGFKVLDEEDLICSIETDERATQCKLTLEQFYDNYFKAFRERSARFLLFTFFFSFLFLLVFFAFSFCFFFLLFLFFFFFPFSIIIKHSPPSPTTEKRPSKPPFEEPNSPPKNKQN